MSIDDLRLQLMYQEASASLRECGLDPEQYLGRDQYDPVSMAAQALPAGWVHPEWGYEAVPVTEGVPSIIVESGAYRCGCAMKKHLDEVSPGWQPSVCQPMPWPKKAIEVQSKSSSSSPKRRAPKRSPPEPTTEDLAESPHQHT